VFATSFAFFTENRKEKSWLRKCSFT